jgi:hypothetical protein
MNLPSLADGPAEPAFAQRIGLDLKREWVIFRHGSIMEPQGRHNQGKIIPPRSNGPAPSDSSLR